MRNLCRQFDFLRQCAGVLTLLCLCAMSVSTLAGETAVEPPGNDADPIQDSTDDGDAPSSEGLAAPEELVDAVPAHPHDVPLADAVSNAAGTAAPLVLLGEAIAPASTQRLAWSATELFEGRPCALPPPCTVTN